MRAAPEQWVKPITPCLPRAQAHEIDQALARLTGIGRTGMGTLFKAMAFTHRELPVPPGFEH